MLDTKVQDHLFFGSREKKNKGCVRCHLGHMILGWALGSDSASS